VKTKPCDPLRIDAFLQANLSPAQEAEFTQHLDQCEICRTSLEDRAAEPFRWGIQRRMTGLGQRLGQEWNEKLGPKLGQEWNEKIGDKLGKQWNERLNGDGGSGK
jgi:hypothetical protein